MDQMVAIDLHAEENVSAGRTSVSCRGIELRLQYDARGTPYFKLDALVLNQFIEMQLTKEEQCDDYCWW